MKIVIDENIPFAREVFGLLGSVVALPGGAISSEVVREASVLVVRSITPVNAALLQGSTVQFVGTATAGCDHIDQEYLKNNKILFASAAGANANSVAEYVISALFLHAQKKEEALRGKTLGIVGVGHVGQLLARKASAIGMIPILNDPPLQRRTGKRDYRSFQEACGADFISLHVPLSNEGEDATRHLLNEKTLRALSPKTLVINTSRGEVIDHPALFKQITARQLAPPILDVWADEPAINWDFLQDVEIGTPHIAGYALDGKVAGTRIIYETLCSALGVMPAWPDQSLPLAASRKIQIDANAGDELTILSNLCGQAYDLSSDVRRFMALLDLPLASRPTAFEHLRKTYPTRREFQTLSLVVHKSHTKLLDPIVGLGFQPLGTKT